nr:hypothetical protein Iba_chr06bCG12780 [Ipomoea batatas]
MEKKRIKYPKLYPVNSDYKISNRDSQTVCGRLLPEIEGHRFAQPPKPPRSHVGGLRHSVEKLEQLEPGDQRGEAGNGEVNGERGDERYVSELGNQVVLFIVNPVWFCATGGDFLGGLRFGFLEFGLFFCLSISIAGFVLGKRGARLEESEVGLRSLVLFLRESEEKKEDRRRRKLEFDLVFD